MPRKNNANKHKKDVDTLQMSAKVSPVSRKSKRQNHPGGEKKLVVMVRASIHKQMKVHSAERGTKMFRDVERACLQFLDAEKPSTTPLSPLPSTVEPK